MQRFTYPAIEIGPGAKTAHLQVTQPVTAGVTEEQLRAQEDLAYRRGLADGQQHAMTEVQRTITEARTAVTNALADFAKERESYFQEVEAEVIALALAVTRKILNREAQVDPLVLRGVVYAALERLSSNTAVRLHVPQGQGGLWQRSFADAARTPSEIIEDPALLGNEVRIETALGNTHLSAESQLKEIEQGFADLLAKSPRSTP